MCGRYTIVITMDELMRYYMLEMPANHFYTPKYNVAPGQMVMAIISDGQKNRLGELKWGLIPNWSKDEKIGYKMINARADTVADKPAFRSSFQRKRCIIPADGFYEWQKIGTEKQPMRITLKDEGIFSMAGLYDSWIAPDGSKVSSCTIITTTPNALMENIHDRMPVILHPEDEAIWLNRAIQDKNILLPLLQPFPAEQMRAYPVTAKVGNVRFDDPECLEELGNKK